MTTYAMIPIDDFVSLCEDRLSLLASYDRLRSAAVSLWNEFLEYTEQVCEGCVLDISGWVDNFNANAEFFWRDEVADSQGFTPDSDADWENWCNNNNINRHNDECAFRY